MTPEAKEKPKPLILPSFHKDLVVYPGPAEPDGTPTYAILDRFRGQYFKVSWAHALVMRVHKPGMSIEELVSAVNARSPLRVEEDEIKDIFSDAANLNLLEIPKRSEDVQQMAEKSKVKVWWWLVMNYLYIRYPLTNPDRFLTNTLEYVKPLISKAALILYSVLTFAGLLVVFFNFDKYIHTFTYFFNFEGVIAYTSAIIGVHILHEFGHAYTAKYYKVHVPTMGVGLMVLMPFLFTNVTDAWKLKARRERFAITIAGVSVEMVLAGLSTLGWALTDPGLLHSIFFVVSSTSWITSLLMNLNPAMRFDGYYLLTDLIGVDNLQQRSFAMTRWKLRQWLLGFDVPPPEDDIPPRTLKLMMVYSVYTWLYRIILYTAIALFVYFQFTKLLGIVLFIVEVLVFIIAPFASEFKQLFKQRANFNWNRRSIITTVVCTFLVVWFVLPWPHTLYLPAVTVAAKEQVIYVPESAAIANIYVKRGDLVHKDQELVQLESNTLLKSIERTKTEIDLLTKTLQILSLSDIDRTFLPPKEAELEHKQAQLEAFEEKQERLSVKAEIDGELHDWENSLHEGMYLLQGAVLGKINQLKEVKVIAFVPEAQAGSLEVGQKATFKLMDPIERFPGAVAQIFKAPSSYLNYPALASTYHGSLPVVQKRGTQPGDNTPHLQLTERYYELEVALEPTEYPLRLGQTGVVEVQGPWESKLWNFVRKVQRVLWQESGF